MYVYVYMYMYMYMCMYMYMYIIGDLDFATIHRSRSWPSQMATLLQVSLSLRAGNERCGHCTFSRDGGHPTCGSLSLL